MVIASPDGTSTIPLSSAQRIISSAAAAVTNAGAPDGALTPGGPAVTLGALTFSQASGSAGSVVIYGDGGTSTVPVASAEGLISSARSDAVVASAILSMVGANVGGVNKAGTTTVVGGSTVILQGGTTKAVSASASASGGGGSGAGPTDVGGGGNGTGYVQASDGERSCRSRRGLLLIFWMCLLGLVL